MVAALVVAVGAVLGFNMIALKVALRATDPITAQAISTVIGALAMFPLTRAMGHPLSLPVRRIPGAFGVGMSMTVGSALGVTFGVQRVNAGLAGLLMSATPIMTLVLDYLITRQRHSWHGPAGVVLGFAGVALVASGSGHTELIGVLSMLGGALGWSLGLVIMKQAGRGVPSSTFTTWQMLLGTPVLLLIAYLAAGMQVDWSWLVFLSLAYAGLGAKSLSFVLQMLVLRVGTALHASLPAFIMPLFAAAGGVLLLGERIRLLEVLGAVAILSGVALVIRSQTGEPPEPAVPA